jgi:hypothetical protein
MCTILILDDNPRQLSWVLAIVKNVLQSVSPLRFLPPILNESLFAQLDFPHRCDPINDERRFAWTRQVLADSGVTEQVSVDIAIIDLCLTNPPQLADPEGLWMCSALRDRFPESFLILISEKSQTDQPSIHGGWFKYVPVPRVRIDEVVGIREDDVISSRTQLATALRKWASLQYSDRPVAATQHRNAV